MTAGTPVSAWVVPPAVDSAHPASEVTPGLIDDLAAELRKGQRRLARRPWREIAEAIGQAADELSSPGPLRRRTLESMAAGTGYSGPMCERVLDGMAADWTAERLARMVEAEGLERALDGWCEGTSGVALRARGFPLTLHVGASTVPGVAATSMVRALLVKSAAWVKPGRGDVALPALLARALARLDDDLGGALAVTYWEGAETPQAALDAVDRVVAYGGNDTIRDLRARLLPTTGLVAYRHRLSLGVVAREAADDTQVVADVAAAVAAFDQRGCVSPHLVLVESGGAIGPREWAAALADALRALASSLPGAAPDSSQAAAIHQLRGAAELRMTSEADVDLWSGPGLAWTVVLDPRATLSPPCLGRTVVVRPVAALDQISELLAPFGGVLQSVGWAGPAGRALDLAERLSRFGVTRVTAFAKQPFPPAWWRHDGAPPLAPLVRWTELDLQS